MAKKKQELSAEPDSVVASSPIEAVKGFDRDLKCRDFQYAIGTTYQHKGTISICASGFHSVEMPLDAWTYYSPATSRYALVELGGATARHKEDSKIVSAEITVKAELKLPDLIRRAVEWVVARADKNIGTGYRGHAAATGDSGHAAATGYRGHAAATGKFGISVALGIEGKAKAGADGWVVLAQWRWSKSDGRCDLVQVKTAKVGGPEGIKAGTFYRLNDVGGFVEVEEAA